MLAQVLQDLNNVLSQVSLLCWLWKAYCNTLRVATSLLNMESKRRDKLVFLETHRHGDSLLIDDNHAEVLVLKVFHLTEVRLPYHSASIHFLDPYSCRLFAHLWNFHHEAAVE